MWILFLFAVENVFERREMAEFLYDGTDCVFTEADVEERRRFFVLFIYFIFFWYLSGRFYWLVDRFRGRFRGRSFLSLFFWRSKTEATERIRFRLVPTRPPATTPASQGVARSLSIGRPFKLRSDGFPAHSDRIDRRNEQQQQQQQQQQQPSQRPQFKEFRRIVSFFLAKRWFFLVGSLTAQSMRLDEMIRIGRFSVGLCRPSIAPMEFDFAT